MNPIKKISRYLLVKYFLLITFVFACQQILQANEWNKKTIDSLEQIVNTTRDDQIRFFALKELARQTILKDPAKALDYIIRSEALAIQMNDSADMALAEFAKGFYLDEISEKDSAIKVYTSVSEQLKKYNKNIELAQCYSFIAGINMDKGNYQQSIYWYQKSNEVAEVLKDENLISKNLMYIGSAYNQMGDHPKGLVFFQKALTLAEKLKNNIIIAQLLLYIGSAYSETPSQEYAMNYFKRCQELAFKLKDTTLLLEADIYIANNHYYNKKYDKAIEIYSQVSQVALLKKDIRTYAGALGNLGNVYADMGDYKIAQEYQFEAVEIFKKEGDNQGLTICYSSIGSNYYSLKQYAKSVEYYQKALVIAKEMNSMEDLIEIHLGLSKTYEALNDYKNAYKNFMLYKQYNDSVYNDGNTKKLTELEMNYRFEAQQKEQELVQKNKETLADEKLKRQKIVSYTSIFGILLLLLLVGVVYRNSIHRKKANIQLQEFNDEVTEQKEIIEYKNKEITDSINYAKRIQESILPLKQEIKESFSESFVLFKPRNVVSGDFYWFAEQSDKKIIACVDCTGHGVPGAFMSMIGNTLLNEIVNEKNIYKPSDILNLLHDRVRQSLKQDIENNETRDGMDIALCVIDNEKGFLEFAGANRSLYLIRKNEKEEVRINTDILHQLITDNQLIEIKPDKMPIGGTQIKETRTFTNNELKIKKGDAIYMSTDGYADQFGGDKGKKFMVRRFHQTLLGIQEQSMEQQAELLKTTIEKWQGDLEQVDDILVIGIRI